MGKKRTQKDRLYLTATEYAQSDAGYKPNKLTTTQQQHNTALIPYNRCAITNKQWDRKQCVTTRDGYYCFDLISIIPYINIHHKHPIFNAPLEITDLIKLHWVVNTYEQLCDPITLKPYNEHSYIVALKTTGNVYNYDTIQSMCIKTNELNDLIDGSKFSLNDIITIQNPNDTTEHNKRFKSIDTDTTSVIKPMKQTTAKSTTPSIDTVHSIYSDNNAAASFTSTNYAVHTQSHGIELSLKELHKQQYTYLANKYKSKPYKAYVTLHTTLGSLNVQIHCDLVPAIAHNFLQHCKLHTYNNTKVGRLQKQYLVQLGQSTTGTDTTAFNYSVDKQSNSKLAHNKRGILAMSGATINQQFYITFVPCIQLDTQYSVFGEVVGNMSVLDKIESCTVDGDHIPLTDIVITGTTIYSNPFDEPYEVKDAATGKMIVYNKKADDNVEKQNKQTAQKPQVYKYDNW